MHNNRVLTYIVIGFCLAAFSLSSAENGSGSPADLPGLTTVKIASGLAKPVFLTAPLADTTRLFILEQHTGLIKIYKNGAILPTPFLDIHDQISFGNEQGLLSLAFHPDYQNNGYFFINYTNTSGTLIISRFTVSGANPDIADGSSEQVILIIPEPESNHNGGTLAFGPNDGYLYISVGDGGGGGDNHGVIGNGQSIDTHLGKILRIDVDHGSPYSSPADNPFVGQNGLDEIWAYGLRNPWRISFDRSTGDLYIADVGQSLWEEIDVQPFSSTGGENYGWRLKEGFHCYNPASDCDPGGLTDPVTEYNHSAGCSITGGYVYRGCAIPDLQGTYFYADYCGATIWSFTYDNGSIVDSTDLTAELDPPGADAINLISSFGEDAFGEIYILDHLDGEIYKIIPSSPMPTGCGSVGCCDFPGDANGDLTVNIGDAVYLVNYIFKGGAAPDCRAEADANADCVVNLGDGVYIIQYVFQSGPAPVCSTCL